MIYLLLTQIATETLNYSPGIYPLNLVALLPSKMTLISHEDSYWGGTETQLCGTKLDPKEKQPAQGQLATAGNPAPFSVLAPLAFCPSPSAASSLGVRRSHLRLTGVGEHQQWL